MSWQLLIGISMLTDAIGRIIQRVVMKGKGSDPIAPAIIYQIIGGIFLGIYAFIVGFHLLSLSSLAINLALTPILWGISNILVFKSLKTTEASIFTILFATRTIWIIIISMLVLHDPFTLQQALGTLLIIAAVILISWKGKKFTFQKGGVFAVLAAIGFSLAIINDAYIVRTVPALPYISYNFIISGLFVWLLYLKKTPVVMHMIQDKKLFTNIFFLSIIYALSSLTYLLAYQVGRNAAKIGAIYPASAMLTVLFAVFFLRERSNLLVKLLAVIISVIGVILVS